MRRRPKLCCAGPSRRPRPAWYLAFSGWSNAPGANGSDDLAERLSGSFGTDAPWPGPDRQAFAHRGSAGCAAARGRRGVGCARIPVLRRDRRSRRASGPGSCWGGHRGLAARYPAGLQPPMVTRSEEMLALATDRADRLPPRARPVAAASGQRGDRHGLGLRCWQAVSPAEIGQRMHRRGPGAVAARPSGPASTGSHDEHDRAACAGGRSCPQPRACAARLSVTDGPLEDGGDLPPARHPRRKPVGNEARILTAQRLDWQTAEAPDLL